MGVAVDVQTNMLRCVQSTSDESLSADARYKHVLNMKVSQNKKLLLKVLLIYFEFKLIRNFKA